MKRVEVRESTRVSMPMPGLIGVVLAGGRSRRMGQDKSRLHWRGRDLLAHQQALLTATACAPVWVVGAHDSGWPLRDALPDSGPLAGLLAALEQALTRMNVQEQQHLSASAPVLLVVPVDMPCLTPACMALLRDASQQDAGAELLCFAGSPLPCALRVSVGLRDRFAQSLQRGERALHRVFASCAGRELTPPPDWLERARNINTPDDWQALLADEAPPSACAPR